MDLELSSGQRELQESVRALLRRHCPRSLVRDVVEKGTAASSLWARQVEQGWPAVGIAAADGGLGLGVVESTIIAQESGRHIAPGPWLSTATQYVPVVRALAVGHQRTSLLAPVAEGVLRGALAVAEDATALRPSRFTVVATSSGDGSWCLRGVKQCVLDADDADLLVVIAGTAGDSEALGAFVVQREEVEVRGVRSVDRSRAWATVELDQVRVPRERVLGEPGSEQVRAAVLRALEEATVALGAELVGVCRELLSMTVNHVTTRVQFGRPVGSFQAVQHKLVDCHVAIERAGALVAFAAAAIDEDDPRGPVAASMAKLAAADCERLMGKEALQCHGGIGYTWEHDLHLLLTRAKADAALLGTAGWHRAAVARHLGLPA